MFSQIQVEKALPRHKWEKVVFLLYICMGIGRNRFLSKRGTKDIAQIMWMSGGS